MRSLLVTGCLLLAVAAAQAAPDPGLPDTLRVGSSATPVGAGRGQLPLSFFNDEPLAGIEVTLTWDSPDVHVDSFSFVGSRVQGLPAVGWSATANSVTIYAIAFSTLVPAGNGSLGTLHVGFASSISPQTVTFDTVTIIQDDVEYHTSFSDAGSSAFTPRFLAGQLEIADLGCCIGDRGNADNDPLDAVDISDLVYLVQYMFMGGQPLACPTEGDVNGAEGIEIGDVIYLVQYMFAAGPPPVPCY